MCVQGSHIYGVYQWKMIAQWCIIFFTPFFSNHLDAIYILLLLLVNIMYPSKCSPSPLLLLVSYTIWTKKLIELYMCITYDNSAAIDKSLIIKKTKLFFTTDSIYVYPFCAVIFDVGIQVLLYFYFSFSPWLLKRSIAIIYLSLNCIKMNLLI